jgi:Tol biopolymer transport system component
MPEDTHEDIRRRLFEAAWAAPTFSPAPRRTVARARRRAAATVGGATVAVLASIVGIAIVAGSLQATPTDRTGNPAMPLDEREFLVDVATGTRTELEGLPAGAYLYDVSPDGSRVAFVMRDPEGRFQVWEMPLDGGEPRQLTHDPYEASNPAWSPDGRKVAYTGFGEADARDVFVVDAATGRSHRVVRDDGDPYLPDWSPNGREIVYSTSITVEREPVEGQPVASSPVSSSQVRIVDVRSGEVSVLEGGASGQAYDAAWDRTSGRIAFVRAPVVNLGHDPDRLWLVTSDADGSDKVSLAEVPFPSWGPIWSPNGTRIAFMTFVDGHDAVYVVDVATGESGPVTRGGDVTWVDEGTLLVQEPVASS